MPYLNANGTDLYYEVHGAGAPIVFAHGMGGNHASWFQQVPFFSRSYQVVTFDQRGFGLSEDANGIGRGAFVDDLVALLDHLRIERTALVAQSMGGLVCGGFTVRYPERVNALVLSDTLVNVGLPEPFASTQARTSEATRTLSQLERVLSKGLVAQKPAMAELYLQIASFNPSNETRMTPSGTPPKPVHLDDLIAAARKVPMLFVVGEEDILFTPEVIGGVSKLVPGARLALLPNAAHSPYFETPDAFNNEVGSFLADVLARESSAGAGSAAR